MCKKTADGKGYSLATHLLLRLIVPLVIGMLIMSLYTVLTLIIALPDWSNDVQAYMRVDTIANIQLRADFKLDLAESYFAQTIDDTDFLADYFDKTYSELDVVQNYGLRNGELSAPSTGGNRASYFGSWYQPGTTTATAQATNATEMYDAFRTLYRANKPKYEGIYIGYEDTGLYMIYPWADMSQYPNFQYTCASNNQAVTGYDPRCRGWYYQARNNPNQVIFTPPYEDALTGNTLITAAKAVYRRGNLVGVIGLDVVMNVLDDAVAQAEVLDNGYAFLMDEDNAIVSYPSFGSGVLDRSLVQTVDDLEPVDERVNTDSFADRVKAAGSNTTDQIVWFSKNGEPWLAFSRGVNAASYYVVMIVPDADIERPIQAVKDDVNNLTITATLIICAILLVAIFFAVKMNIRVTNIIITPVRELIRVTDEISNHQFGVEMDADVSGGSMELDMIYGQFKNLILALRFGNTAYYHGDLHLAWENYVEVENMMIRMNNQRGLGVCHNNMGNVLKQLRSEENNRVQGDAGEYYVKAIENVKNVLKEEKDQKEIVALEGVMANRYMNYGSFLKDQNPPQVEEAYNAYQTALELHRKHSNLLGIAKVCGNLGQFMLSQNDIGEAEKLIVESYNNAVEGNDETSLQYSCMNMGILREAQNNPQRAIVFYRYALSFCERIEKFVEQTCLAKLEGCFAKLNMHDQVRAMKLNRPPRHVLFCLDVSGSMAGGKINQCRGSMNYIIENVMLPQDAISLTVFSTDVRDVFIRKSMDHDRDFIMYKITNDTKPGGITAFYDAVLHTLQQTKRRNSISVSGNSGGLLATREEIKERRGSGAARNSLQVPRQRRQSISQNTASRMETWVVCLTDGSDNASKVKPKRLCQELKSIDLGAFICITVGRLENIAVIQQIVGSSSNGHLVEATGAAAAIREAFAEVAKMMTSSQLSVESL